MKGVSTPVKLQKTTLLYQGDYMKKQETDVIPPPLKNIVNSARALVKKTQEPGIKLQKADFFRNDTWTSPQTNSEDAPKIPLVHFFLIQDGRHHVTPFSKNRGIP